MFDFSNTSNIYMVNVTAPCQQCDQTNNKKNNHNNIVSCVQLNQPITTSYLNNTQSKLLYSHGLQSLAQFECNDLLFIINNTPTLNNNNHNNSNELLINSLLVYSVIADNMQTLAEHQLDSNINDQRSAITIQYTKLQLNQVFLVKSSIGLLGEILQFSNIIHINRNIELYGDLMRLLHEGVIPPYIQQVQGIENIQINHNNQSNNNHSNKNTVNPVFRNDLVEFNVNSFNEPNNNNSDNITNHRNPTVSVVNNEAAITVPQLMSHHNIPYVTTAKIQLSPNNHNNPINNSNSSQLNTNYSAKSNPKPDNNNNTNNNNANSANRDSQREKCRLAQEWRKHRQQRRKNYTLQLISDNNKNPTINNPATTTNTIANNNTNPIIPQPKKSNKNKKTKNNNATSRVIIASDKNNCNKTHSSNPIQGAVDIGELEFETNLVSPEAVDESSKTTIATTNDQISLQRSNDNSCIGDNPNNATTPSNNNNIPPHNNPIMSPTTTQPIVISSASSPLTMESKYDEILSNITADHNITSLYSPEPHNNSKPTEALLLHTEKAHHNHEHVNPSNNAENNHGGNNKKRIAKTTTNKHKRSQRINRHNNNNNNNANDDSVILLSNEQQQFPRLPHLITKKNNKNNDNSNKNHPNPDTIIRSKNPHNNKTCTTSTTSIRNEPESRNRQLAPPKTNQNRFQSHANSHKNANDNNCSRNDEEEFPSLADLIAQHNNNNNNESCEEDSNAINRNKTLRKASNNNEDNDDDMDVEVGKVPQFKRKRIKTLSELHNNPKPENHNNHNQKEFNPKDEVQYNEEDNNNTNNNNNNNDIITAELDRSVLYNPQLIPIRAQFQDSLQYRPFNPQANSQSTSLAHIHILQNINLSVIFRLDEQMNPNSLDIPYIDNVCQRIQLKFNLEAMDNSIFKPSVLSKLYIHSPFTLHNNHKLWYFRPLLQPLLMANNYKPLFLISLPRVLFTKNSNNNHHNAHNNHNHIGLTRVTAETFLEQMLNAAKTEMFLECTDFLSLALPNNNNYNNDANSTHYTHYSVYFVPVLPDNLRSEANTQAPKLSSLSMIHNKLINPDSRLFFQVYIVGGHYLRFQLCNDYIQILNDKKLHLVLQLLNENKLLIELDNPALKANSYEFEVNQEKHWLFIQPQTQEFLLQISQYYHIYFYDECKLELLRAIVDIANKNHWKTREISSNHNNNSDYKPLIAISNIYSCYGLDGCIQTTDPCSYHCDLRNLISFACYSALKNTILILSDTLRHWIPHDHQCIYELSTSASKKHLTCTYLTLRLMEMHHLFIQELCDAELAHEYQGKSLDSYENKLNIVTSTFIKGDKLSQ